MNLLKLKSFLSNDVFHKNIIVLKNLNRGGSSTNLICQTLDNKYLIKLLPNKNIKRTEHLLDILTSLKKVPEIYTSHVVEFNQKQYFEFEEYVVIIIEFLDGKKLKYHELDKTVLDKIFSSYQHIKKLDYTCLNQRTIPEIYAENKELINEISANKLCFLKKKILNAINNLNESLNSNISPKGKPVIIHGDASLNNMIEDKNKNIALLDFELMRLGFEVEDWSEFLISSLSQHYIFSFPEKKFAELVVYVNELMNFSKQDWQYGINLYFLNLIKKRLKSKKLFKSIRKAMLFTLNFRKYQIISNVIEKIY